MAFAATGRATVTEYGRLPVKEDAGFHEHVSTLAPSQREIVTLLNDWCRNRRFLLVLVTGGPGSGKTHAVVETLERLDLRVVKMAYTGRHAHRIGGHTVHRTMQLSGGRRELVDRVWDRLAETEDPETCMAVTDEAMPRDGAGAMCCSRAAADAVVVDEVGMLPFWLIQRMVAYFRDRYPAEQQQKQQRERRQVIMFCMGDDRQLRPVRSRLNVFDVPDFETRWMGGSDCETRRVRMTESQRFTPEYDEIVRRLRELMEVAKEEEEDIDEKHPLFVYLTRTFPVAPCITQEMMWKARIVLSFKNDTIDACNRFYLEKMMICEEEHSIPSSSEGEPKTLRRNCRVVVTENGCGVVDGDERKSCCYNGSELVFLKYDRTNDVAVCFDERTGREVRVRRSRYSREIPLVPGFAVTIHKFQGETIDENGIVMSFDKSKDLNLIYTALSRVRDLSQIVAVVF